MAIALRTVSINPAFLQEIKDDHHELRQLMHHICAMLGRSGPAEIEYPRLVEMFGKLRDQLAMHFSLEEAYGYFDDAISVAPHLSRRAESLRSQHSGLFSEACQLAESAEQLSRHENADTPLARVAAASPTKPPSANSARTTSTCTTVWPRRNSSACDRPAMPRWKNRN